MQERGLEVKSQVAVPVVYRDKKLDVGFRVDLLVEDQVVIEVKSIETLHNVHKKQVATYLKLTGCKIGLLVDFNVSFLEDEISLVRIIL